MYNTGRELDEDYYTSHYFPSVHIGELVMKSLTLPASTQPLVSVIMPVFNGQLYIKGTA